MRNLRFVPVLLTALFGTAVAATLAPQGAPEVTDHHRTVVGLAGSYEGTMSVWMPGSEQPMKSPCTEEIVAVGELWTTSRFEMEMMGMPFSGAASMGYDPEKKKFVGTWIDSTTPTLIFMEGNWNEDKTAIVMSYEANDPMMGGKVQMEMTMTPSEEGYSSNFYIVNDEGRQLSMSTDMTRVDS